MAMRIRNLLRREPLGELTTVEQFWRDGLVATVARETQAGGKQGWVVIEEWGDGQSMWVRLSSLMAAIIFATDGQAMRP